MGGPSTSHGEDEAAGQGEDDENPDHTGQPLKRIQDDTERDYIMSADQGKEYGIIDDVIRKRA